MTSTDRSRRLRACRARGVAMVSPVEVGEDGIEILLSFPKRLCFHAAKFERIYAAILT